jgi:hypothetical protein
MTAAVGADIESICSKCGDVWHVVVAKVGEKIAKVQCKQCHGFHRYKPPGGLPAPVRTKAGAAAPRPRKAAAPEPEPAVAADPSRPVRRYAPGDAYTAGDRINHPTFGQGVVESSPGPGKMQVFFPSGRRILAQAKAPGSGLERRGPLPED